MINNFQTNVFKYINEATAIASIVTEMYTNWNTIDIANLAVAATTFTSLGKEAGTLLRNIIGFKDTFSTGGKPAVKPTTPTLF